MTLGKSIIIFVMISFSVSILLGISPLTTVKDSNKKVLKIYRENKTMNQQVVDRIFNVISSVSDFKKTADKIAIKYRVLLSSDEYTKFTEILEKYLILALKVRLKKRIVISFEYPGETVKGNSAVVRSRVYYKNRKVNMDYILEKEHDQWKVYNYRVEDSDSILSYQKQFTKLFDRYPFSKILSKLKIKVTKLKLRLEDKSF